MRDVRPLTIDELEEGVRLLEGRETDHDSFWKVNGAAYNCTLLVAMRETSDTLSCEGLSPAWREELEVQLERLLRCFDEQSGFGGSA